eukprot:1986327-Rhodomonas_salina.1
MSHHKNSHLLRKSFASPTLNVLPRICAHLNTVDSPQESLPVQQVFYFAFHPTSEHGCVCILNTLVATKHQTHDGQANGLPSKQEVRSAVLERHHFLGPFAELDGGQLRRRLRLLHLRVMLSGRGSP